MSHACELPHQMGSCVELDSGEYWLTLSCVAEAAVSMTVDYCPFCGSRAAQPSSLTCLSGAQ